MRREGQAIGLRFREQGLDAVLHARGEGAEASGLSRARLAARGHVRHEACGLHALLRRRFCAAAWINRHGRFLFSMRPVTHMRGVSMRRMRRSMVAACVTPSAIRRSASGAVACFRRFTSARGTRRPTVSGVSGAACASREMIVAGRLDAAKLRRKPIVIVPPPTTRMPPMLSAPARWRAQARARSGPAPCP